MQIPQRDYKQYPDELKRYSSAELEAIISKKEIELAELKKYHEERKKLEQ